jgi:hypothetical protein
MKKKLMDRKAYWDLETLLGLQGNRLRVIKAIFCVEMMKSMGPTFCTVEGTLDLRHTRHVLLCMGHPLLYRQE